MLLQGGLLNRNRDDMDYFIGMLTLRSWAHLREIMTKYQEAHGHGLKKLVATQEFSLDEQAAINGIGSLFFLLS